MTKFNHTQSLSGVNRYPSSDEEDRKGGTALNSYRKAKNIMQRTSSVSSMSKAGKLDEIIKKSQKLRERRIQRSSVGSVMSS